MEGRMARSYKKLTKVIYKKMRVEKLKYLKTLRIKILEDHLKISFLRYKNNRILTG